MPNFSEIGHDAELKAVGPKIGQRLGGGLRSAGPGLSFVDITGTVDADTDGIVFEGKPGLERPIIPRFVVPKELARKLSKLTMGDAEEIERQRRAGNSSIQFDENKLRSIIESIGGDTSQLNSLSSSSRSNVVDTPRPGTPDDKDSTKLTGLSINDILSGSTNTGAKVTKDSLATAIADRIFSRGEWSDEQKQKIISQSFDLAENLVQLVKNPNLTNFKSHPMIGLSIQEIVDQAEIRINPDGIVSVRLPVNTILRSLIPGDRNYQDVVIPNRNQLINILKDMEGNIARGQWSWLVDQMERGEDQSSIMVMGLEDRALLARGGQISKLLLDVISKKLDKIPVNKDPMKAKDLDIGTDWTNPYFYLMSNPHGFKSFMDSLLQMSKPDIALHDLMGHWTNGNMFDRHGEWANILAVIDLVRNKDSWNELRRNFPELENLTDLDRDIFIRSHLMEFAPLWLSRAMTTPKGNAEAPKPGDKDIDPITHPVKIKQLLAEYNGPIDDVLDKLDPPTSSRSSRSAQSIPLKDGINDHLSGIIYSAAEVFSVHSHIEDNPDSSRSTATDTLKPFSEAVDTLDAQNEDIEEISIPILRAIEALRSGELDSIKTSNANGKSLADILNNSKVLKFNDGIISIAMEPIAEYADLIPGDRDWSEVQLPRKQSILEFARALITELRQNEDNQIAFRERLGLSDSIQNKLTQLTQDAIGRQSSGGDTSNFEKWRAISESSFSSDGPTSFFPLSIAHHLGQKDIPGLTGPSEVDHDVIGHLGTGRGFDRHGEWANALAVITVAIHPDSKISSSDDEKDAFVQYWLQAFAQRELATVLYESDELSDEFEQLFSRLPESSIRRNKDGSINTFATFFQLVSASGKNIRNNINILDDSDSNPNKPRVMSMRSMSPAIARSLAINELEIKREREMSSPVAPGQEPSRRIIPRLKPSPYRETIDPPKRRRAAAPPPPPDDPNKRSGMRSTSGPNEQVTEESIRAQLRKIDDDLDNERISLPEYRRRQRDLNSQLQALRGNKKKPVSETRTPKRDQLIKRGDGMIERDERGRPAKWDGEAFLRDQRDKQVQRLRDLGFSEDEISILMGPSKKSDSGQTPSSRSAAMKLELFSLFSERVTPERGTRRSPDLTAMSDLELRNALEIYDVRPPRKQEKTGLPLVPAWFPTRDQLVLELEDRGYQVFKTPGTSRRHQDMIHVVSPNLDADDIALSRRVAQPTSTLSKFIDAKEKETGQRLFASSRIKDWSFIERLSKLDDASLSALNLEFDKRRGRKVRERQNGIISNDEFDQWYRELTTMRRYLSDELTRRSLRKALSSRSSIKPQNDDTMTLSSYVFMKKAMPSLKSQRSFGPVVDSLIAEGRVTESTFNTIADYHNIKDFQFGQLSNALRAGLELDLSKDIDLSALNARQLDIARDIFNQYETKLANDLSRLDLSNFSSDELLAIGIEGEDIDDILDGKPTISPSIIASSRSKNRKNKKNQQGDKKRMRPSTKLTAEQVRISQEQKLRAKKIPGKRKQGPSISDWRESRTRSHQSSSSARARNVASIYDLAIGRNPSTIGRNINIDGRNRYISLADDVRVGDILPDGFNNSVRVHGEPRYKVLSVKPDSPMSRLVGLQDLRNGGFLSMPLDRDQALADVVRPTSSSRSMRSSRVGLPVVRNRVYGMYERGSDDEITGYLDDLLGDLQSVWDQIRLIDSQAGSDDLSEIDEQRSVDLEAISEGLVAEINEVLASISAIGQQSLDFQMTREAIKRAKSRVSQYGTYGEFRTTMGGGLADVNWEDVVSLVRQQDRELKATTFFRDHDRIQGLIEKINTSVRDGQPSSIDEIDTYDLDLEFDSHQKEIDRQAQDIISQAITSVARAADIQKARNTVINATAREMDPESILAIGPGSSRSSSGATSLPVVQSGNNLLPFRRIYPGGIEKFEKSNLTFVNFDGNLNEIVAGLPDGSVVRYGGIDANMLSQFIDPRQTATASMNNLDKVAGYIVRSSGSSRGSVPSFSKLLKRDRDRVALSKREKNLVDSLVRSFDTNNADELESISPDEVHAMVARLFRDNESAMAVNVLDALSGARSIRKNNKPLASLYGETIPAPAQDLKLIMRADEIGEIRDELSDLRKKYSQNNQIASALKTYDDLLKKSQTGESTSQVMMTPSEYISIIDGYSEIARFGSAGDGDLIGRAPLELAALSPRQEFDSAQNLSTPFSRRSGSINRGAPLDMGPDKIDSLAGWAANNSDSNIVRELANGPSSASKWRGLDALSTFWPASPRKSRAMSDYSNIGNADLGSPLSALKSENYSSLKPVDKLIWLNENIATPENKKGIRRSDAFKEAQAIFDTINMADQNISRYQDISNFINSGNSADNPQTGVVSNLANLLPSTRRLLNEASTSIYGRQFADLNPMQALSTLRRMSSTSGKSKFGEIQPADLSLILEDLIPASDDLIPAIRSRSMNKTPSVDLSLPRPIRNQTKPRQATIGSRRGISVADMQPALTKFGISSDEGRSPTQPTARTLSALESRRQQSLLVASALDRFAEDLETSYSSRYGDRSTSNTLRSLQAIFASRDDSGRFSPNDFTMGDLDNAIATVDDFLQSPNVLDIRAGRWDSVAPDSSPAAQRALLNSVGQMQGLRTHLASLRNKYGNDPFIGSSASKPTPSARNTSLRNGLSIANSSRIPPVDDYLSARNAGSMRSSSGGREGRAEIRAEATQFKKLYDMLDREASKASDTQVSNSLTKLKEIMRRQKSAVISDKRTNAGALFLTQSELDDIIEALYVAMDRQMDRDNPERTQIFADFTELMAKAAMATFIDGTVEPIQSRTVKRMNQQGEEVEISLYE